MTLDYHPLIVCTVASLKPNTAEARCMTTREGSRASRYGAKDAGSFGTAVSSALPTVDLSRPCPPPAVGARGEPRESNEQEMSERRPEPCGSHVERSRGECIKQEITARSPKMRCSSTA